MVRKYLPKSVWVAWLLVVIAIPLILITSTARWAVNEMRLYEYGFDRYRIAEATGLDRAQLSGAAQQIRAYFNSRDPFLDVQVTVDGQERSLYNQREVLHMKDVKSLVRGVYHVQEGTILYVLLFVLVGLLIQRDATWKATARAMGIGGLLTIVVVAVIGLLSLVAFNQIFLVFHLLSFRNLLWQLDPSTDFLIRMFPEAFFRDATVLIGLATVLEAALIGVIGWSWYQAQKAAERARLLKIAGEVE